MRIILIRIFVLIPAGAQTAEILQGAPAPDFTLNGLEGRSVHPQDYRGKVVLLFFMTSWTRNCGEVVPHLKQFYSLYAGKGLVLFNIDVMESKKRAEAFVIFPTPRCWTEPERFQKNTRWSARRSPS